ncbi:MAG: TonB-dependent receptor plug domain-containing protein, partial [Candidatus Saccharimonadales bacterium]
LDGMAGYVAGFNGQLWGMGDYLVLVDGVPRDAAAIEPSSIEQISFLKGVSAVALYGSRAANGVILITTKRGGDHKLQFDARVNSGVFVPIEYPQYLGSAKYMTLYNEARQNDGLSQLYDQTTIYRYASGEDPYRYPNVDYYSPDYLKKFYSRHDADLEVSGGNKNARFYTNINYTKTGSLLNFGRAKKDGSNHFSIRGNVDLNINRNLSAYVDAAAIYDLTKGVNSDFWGGAATLRPNSFIPLIPISRFASTNPNLQEIVNNNTHVVDGKYLLGGTQLYPTNPIGDIYAGGSNEGINRQFQLNMGVNANLERLLKGLTFHSTFAVDYQASYTEAFNNQYAVYEPE